MTEVVTKIKPKFSFKEPNMYNVVYMNDDSTSMEFVVSSLIAVFDHTHEMAQSLTDEVHTQGSAVVATLPFEIAEQKGMEATQLARANGFPLVIKLIEDK